MPPKIDHSGAVPSPCTRLCMLDETLGHCLGCGRTREEIARWSWSSDDERLAIVQRAKARRDDPLADG